MAELPTKIEAALEAGRPPDFAFGFWLSTYIPTVGPRGSAGGSLGRHRALLEPVRSGSARSGRCCSTQGPGSEPVRPADGPDQQLHPRLEEPPWSGRASRSRTSPRSGSRSGRSGATRCSRRCARHRAATTSGASACPCRSRPPIPRTSSSSSSHRLRGGLRDPDGRLVIDDPEIGSGSSRAMRQLHGDLPQGLHPARFGDLGRWRQQRGVPGPDGRDDAELVALDPQRAQERASRRLLQEHATIEWPLGPSGRAFPIEGVHLPGCGLQGRRQRRDRQGVRPLPRGRGLADALSRLLRRAHAAIDTGAARPAVLARSERPAPHGRGDAGRVATAGSRLRRASGDLGHDQIYNEEVWAKAIHRVVTEGISPEQAVDEAIARIKQILSESDGPCVGSARVDLASLGARMAPLGAQAADLVVWWEKGYYAQEDEAVREIVAAFEQETGKQVELVFSSRGGASGKIWRRSRPASRPTSPSAGSTYRGMGLRGSARGPHGRHRPLFGPVRSGSLRGHACSTPGPGKGPVRPADGPIDQHVHVWKSLLEQAGFTLEDIPKEWDAFWSFWCDQVQPAVRAGAWAATTSGASACPCRSGRYPESVLPVRGRLRCGLRDPRWPLVIDDPEIRRKLIEAIDSYTAIYRKGCTPPDSVAWTATATTGVPGPAVVMTPNETLSIPTRSSASGPRTTTRTPRRSNGHSVRRRAIPDRGPLSRVVFKDGGHVAATAKEFVRFLVAEGWLLHYLDFSGERMLPPMSKLLDQPFWLDPSDPHRMAAVMQVSIAPAGSRLRRASGDWRHDLVWQEGSGRRRSTASSPRASAPSRRSTRRSPASSRS